MRKFGSFVRSKNFELIFMILGFLSIFYVTNRLDLVIQYSLGWHLKLVIAVILLIVLGYMVSYIKSDKRIKQTRRLYEVCSVFLCFLLHLLICLWMVDFINIFFNLGINGYIFALIMAVILTAYGFFNAKAIKIVNYNIPLKTKEKIVLLSDVHIGSFVDQKQLSKIITKVNQLQPDQIIIAGDLFDVEAYDYCNIADIVALLKKLNAKNGIYAILGNHDVPSSSDKMRKVYQSANIKVLIDEYVELKDMVIVGRDDILTNPKRKAIEEIIKTPKELVVIDHNPLGVVEAVANRAVLVMCGHTHRGQFFPANVFTKLAYGKDEFYGYHKIENTNVVVSSGVGYFQMPMRTFSHSEIVVINTY